MFYISIIPLFICVLIFWSRYNYNLKDVPKNEKLTRSMLKYGRKNFTNECTEKSWIEIMNRDDQLLPYDFVL